MSFNVNLNISKNEDKEKEHSSTQVVIYEGREVALDSAYRVQNNLSPTFSLETIFLNYGRLLEIDLNRGLNHLPPAFVRNLRKVDQFFQLFQAPSQQKAFTLNFETGQLSERDLTIEEEIEQEEEKQKLKSLMQNQLQETFHQAGVAKQHRLQLAGVVSEKELQEKETAIANYRATAEKCYLQNPHHLQQRKEIDIGLLKNFQGFVSTQEKRIIREFWDYMTTDQGNSKQAFVSTLVLELMNTFSERLEDSMVQENDKSKTMKPSQWVVHQAKEVLQKVGEDLKAKRQQCQDHEEELLLDYLTLHGRYLILATMNRSIRNRLKARLKQAEAHIEGLAEVYKSVNSFQIQTRQKAILTYQQEIQERQQQLLNLEKEETEAKIKWEEWEKIIMSDPKADIEAPLVRDVSSIAFERKCLEKRNKRCMEYLEFDAQQLKELQAYTEEDFRKMTYDELKETPEDIQACIPEETFFESLLLKIQKLESQAQGLGFSEPTSSLFPIFPDIQLNLQELQDPVAYFFQKIQALDEEKLKLLKPKVEEYD